MEYYKSNTNDKKLCPRCNLMLLRSEFYKDSSRSDGITAYCKKCKRGVNNDWRGRNPDKVNSNNIWWRREKQYGITQDQFRILIKNQNFQCDICLEEIDDSSHVDHDHETGKVRGILCRSCNQGLGFFKDSTGLLEKAIRYLLK